MDQFTPVTALSGGVLIGLSAVLLFWLLGRVAGISGILFGAMERPTEDDGWRLWFLAGLLLGPLLMILPHAVTFVPRSGFPAWALLGGGVLVGMGTRLSGGCTSGHGVCGLGLRSQRSLVATMTFMATGMLTVYVVRHVLEILP
mgnify:FL=1